jgi:hypothetical protein
MRYIDRRFLFPVAAATTAWAQQQSPEATKAEVELRARVSQFFQLQVDKKYRQAESMVADDSKDGYYDGPKYNIKYFKIDRIEMLDGNTHAKVIIKGGVTLAMPAAGGAVELDAPATSLWKLENGQWFYYLDQDAALVTPFGKLTPGTQAANSLAPPRFGKAPDIAALRNAVRADRTAVLMTADAPRQTVTISNGLPGAIDIQLDGNSPEGFSVEIEKKHLEANETTQIRFAAWDRAPHSSVVRFNVVPLNTTIEIQLTSK